MIWGVRVMAICLMALGLYYEAQRDSLWAIPYAAGIVTIFITLLLD